MMNAKYFDEFYNHLQKTTGFKDKTLVAWIVTHPTVVNNAYKKPIGKTDIYNVLPPVIY